jgi:hypothetical protein
MPLLRIFVSRPSVLTHSQVASYSRWLGELAALGFEATEIERANYAPCPWDQLCDAIRGADGVLVLGFRQLSIEAGCWRPGTPEMVPAAGWHPTPWNQVEAGLAIMAGVPVLIVPDPGINDGVFAPEVWSGSIFGVAGTRDDDVTNNSADAVWRWAEAVRERHSRESARSALPSMESPVSIRGTERPVLQV